MTTNTNTSTPAMTTPSTPNLTAVIRDTKTGLYLAGMSNKDYEEDLDEVLEWDTLNEAFPFTTKEAVDFMGKRSAAFRQHHAITMVHRSVLGLTEDELDMWDAWQQCGGTMTDSFDVASSHLVGLWDDVEQAAEAIGRDRMDHSQHIVPDWLVIDWEDTWERNLRHDFASIEHAINFYVFRLR
jgi:hypothetical protein